MMTKKPEEGATSVVQDDGLRYKRKSQGSPYGAGTTTSLHLASMSCFKCGMHRPRSELQSKRLLGKNQLVCAGGCKAR